MSDPLTRMVDLIRKADALDEFKELVEGLRDLYMHDLVKANDNNALHAVRGQLSICNMFADAVAAALQSDKAKANAEFEEGIPQ